MLFMFSFEVDIYSIDIFLNFFKKSHLKIFRFRIYFFDLQLLLIYFLIQLLNMSKQFM